jgi:hypothetical protein
MDANDDDDPTDDDDVMTHRARAKGMLDQIAEQARIALAEQGFDTPVFFIVPSGEAIVTFGTIIDPPDDQWKRVSDVVVSVVRQLVGLDRTRCREVVCATTDSAVDHQPAQCSDQPTGPLASKPMPMQQLEGNCQ